MKITNFAIAFVTILLPFLFINNTKVNTQRLTSELEIRYNASVDTAVRDAANALNFNIIQENEAQYESKKNINVNIGQSIKTFWNTMYINFDAQNDKVAQGVLQRYVPAVVIVGYDGYHLYTMDKYLNSSNQSETKHVLQPKKPYAYVDERGNSLSFTLDDFVTAYDSSTNTWHYGRRAEVAIECPSIELLQNAETFDNVRRSKIVSSIQSDLQYFINYYNEHTKRYGIAYTFTLPTISHEEWNNTIDDVGVLAFVQGVPVGNTTYNHYALGGSRIIKRPEIKGAIENSTGIKYYFRNVCQNTFTSSDYSIKESFGSEKEAASEGYFPLSCENPTLITHKNSK